MSLVVVVAKAPVPGLAKTRIAADVGPDAAARMAAAALLDTLEAAAAWAPRGQRLLALDGRVGDGPMAAAIVRATSSWHVVGQRAGGLDVRLAGALASAGALWGTRPVLLIGMDTPQATPDDFDRLERQRRRVGPRGAALGAAEDGGWWGLAASDPALGRALVGVPMSTPQTGALTAEALSAAGAAVVQAHRLRDMDTLDDARAIAAERPELRVARELDRVVSELVAR